MKVILTIICLYAAAVLALWYEPLHEGEWGVCTDGKVYTICTSTYVDDPALFPYEVLVRWYASRMNRRDDEKEAVQARAWRKHD